VNDVQRWTLATNYRCGQSWSCEEMEKADEWGEWVKFEDYDTLNARLATLEAENTRLSAALAEAQLKRAEAREENDALTKWRGNAMKAAQLDALTIISLTEKQLQAEAALAEARRERDAHKADYQRISDSHGEWVDLHTRQQASLATLEAAIRPLAEIPLHSYTGAPLIAVRGSYADGCEWLVRPNDAVERAKVALNTGGKCGEGQ
jgi:hypothetical protein